MQKAYESQAHTEQDILQLRDKAYEIAKQHLENKATVETFGLAMTPDGTVGQLNAGQEPGSPADQAERIRGILRTQAQKTGLKATAVVQKVSVTDRDTGQLTDAIAVLIDHRENGALEVYYPFRLADGRTHWQVAIQRAGQQTIFR